MAGGTKTGSPNKRVRFSADEGPSIESAPIAICAGLGKLKFFVHEELLRASSEFFNNALKKEWKEGKEKVINLPEVHSDFFRAWVKFLYTGRVFIGDGDDSVHADESKTQHEELGTWGSLYALGDFLADDDFKDALIDTMIDWMDLIGKYSLALPNFIYPHSTNGSVHRQLAVDLFVKRWDRKHYEDELDHSREFMHDALKAIGPNLSAGIKTVVTSRWFRG
ncbi:hypothetical protein J4E91_006191 [Alternaria rosae]|nr:hypothetical protein J4E91_006191 [Alternaria rosae]